jgi:hypothetical protein
MNGEKSNTYRLLVGKRPLGRPRCRWVENIRMDLGEVGWGNVDWIGLAQDRNRWRALVNSVLNLGNYPVTEHLVASRVVLSFIELVHEKFSLVLVAPKDGQLRPNQVGDVCLFNH